MNDRMIEIMSQVTVDSVLLHLKRLYPEAKCSLDWTTPLELLVATILSAQCTDKRVNIVTKTLFHKYRSPEEYLAVPLSVLEQDIHSCGTFRMKAKAIQESCTTIIKKFHGEVPRTMSDMLELRGVGRKTASIVLGTAFGIIEGIPIDTHCLRLSERLGLTKERTQAKIELDLMKKTPRKYWLLLSHLLVTHGRTTCVARTPKCEECIFKDVCPSFTVQKRQKRQDALRTRLAMR